MSYPHNPLIPHQLCKLTIDKLVDGHTLLWESLNGVPVEVLRDMQIYPGISGMKGLQYLAGWDKDLAGAILGSGIKMRSPWETKSFSDKPFDVLLDEMHAARNALINAIANQPLEKLEQWLPFLNHCAVIDQVFYDCFMPLDLNTEPGFTCTARQVVLYGLETARKGFIRRLLDIPLSTWLVKNQGDEWNLKDMIGHLADWEFYNAYATQAFSKVGASDWEITKTGFEEWNREHAVARRAQNWNDAFFDSAIAYKNIITLTQELSIENLFRRNPLAPSGWREYPYGWLSMSARHYREHYAALDQLSDKSAAPDIILVDQPDEPYMPGLVEILAQNKLTAQLIPTVELAKEMAHNMARCPIVIEIGLPDGDGAAFFDNALSIDPNNKILVLTRLGYDRRHWLMRNLPRGNCQLVYKPISSKKLLEAILKLVTEGEMNAKS